MEKVTPSIFIIKEWSSRSCRDSSLLYAALLAATAPNDYGRPLLLLLLLLWEH